MQDKAQTIDPPAPDEADKALAQDDDKRVRDLLRECEQRTGIDLASDSWPNDLVDRVKGYGVAIKRAAYLQAARDVCCYCGGRATAFFSSVGGPNKAANFTHQHRTDKDAQALCKASAIYMRLEAASKQER